MVDLLAFIGHYGIVSLNPHCWRDSVLSNPLPSRHAEKESNRPFPLAPGELGSDPEECRIPPLAERSAEALLALRLRLGGQ